MEEEEENREDDRVEGFIYNMNGIRETKIWLSFF
jgi:hypothetical protein